MDFWFVRRMEFGSWLVLCFGGMVVGIGMFLGCIYVLFFFFFGLINRRLFICDFVIIDICFILFYKIYVVYVLVFFYINLIIIFFGFVFSYDCGDIKIF